MSAEIISAISGLAGVGVGSVATLLAARVTARGSEQQADAQREQAVAAYRAALDSAREQVKGAAAQRASEARRPIYAAFLRSAHKLSGAVSDFAWDCDPDVQEHLRALDETHETQADLDLEGPEEIAELGRQILSAAVEASQHAAEIRDLVVTVRKMIDMNEAHPATASEIPEERIVYQLIKRDLAEVRAAARILPEGTQEREFAYLRWLHPDMAWRWSDEESNPEETPQETSEVARLHDALNRASRGGIRQALRMEIFTDMDAETLYRASITFCSQDPIDHIKEVASPVRRITEIFAAEARAVLHTDAQAPVPSPDLP